MTSFKTMAFLICTTVSLIAAGARTAANEGTGNWHQYSLEPNGDIHFYDSSRVESETNLHRVWSRIRYKTSVMGASSYQSLLEIDCSEGTEKILQNTFFSDKNWEKRAMKTDMVQKPKRLISKDSASERLSKLLCN